MQVITRTVGILGTNCYIVVDEAHGKAAVIDPGDAGDTILAAVRDAGADLAAILLTHGHVDHIGGLTELARATGAPVYVHPEDRVRLSAVDAEFSMLLPAGYEPPALTEALEDGEEVRVADLVFRVIHTPGHTRGSCSFLIDGELFTGDLLFAGSVGRTDLPGGDSRALMRSLIERILPLPDATIIRPGHGESTTLGVEKAENPFLQLERLQWRG